jgi:hypothetical protein
MKNPFNFETEPFELDSEFDEYEEEQPDAHLEFDEEFEAEPFETYPEFEESDELPEEHEEEEFRVSDLPNNVREAFGMGPLAWPLVVQRAIEAGMRDSAKLANIVFYLHHPERRGQALNPSEPDFKKLSSEWKAWRTLIEPILKKTLDVPAQPALGPSIGPKPTLYFTPVPVESPGRGRIKDKREPRKEDLVTVIGYKGRKVPLHRLAAQALEVMIRAARADGIPKPLLELVSGYRSVAHQEKLWKIGLKKHGSAEEARKWIAPPGHSAHHSGRAVDLWMGLGIGKRNASAMRKGVAYKWMVNNAVRFGFYPYEAEPWHWEYNPPVAGQFELDPETYETFELPDEYEDEGVDIFSEFDGELETFETGLADELWEGESNRSNPDYIRWIQGSLNKILGLRLAIDGVMRPQTRSAVRSFQQRQGLKADGIVGSRTEAALIAARASPPPRTGIRTPSSLIKPEEPPGYTLYVNIPLGSESPAKPKTGIFIPKNYVPRSQVDLVLYLHGHKTTRVCGPGDETSIDRYWRSRYWPLRENINESHKNVILVAPTLGPHSQAGRLIERGGLNWYLDQVLASLRQHSLFAQAQRPPTVGTIILACHSGGGSPMFRLAKFKGGGGYAEKIVECWGFDCLYANKPDDPEKEGKQAWLAGEWARWANSHKTSKLYIYYLGSTKETSEKLKAKNLSNVFVEKSTAPGHCQVPITHWLRRIREARFLADI